MDHFCNKDEQNLNQEKETESGAVNEMTVGNRLVGPDASTFFVVEEGQANNGDYDMALEMIDLAARVGADAIEFQFAIADDFYIASHPVHAIYKSREFSRVQLQGLREAAKDAGLLISATPLSDRLVVPLAEAEYALLTVNASDITNPRMLDAVAHSGLPFMIGTAMATIEEIDWAVERLLRRGATSFCLLHGQHIMTSGSGNGVPESEVSLSTISFLQKRYCLPVGFTDHTSNKFVPALAAAHGANVVTKHLAPRAEWRGPDFQVCLSPDEMIECRKWVHLADLTKGSPQKQLASGELADRREMRRSVVAAGDLPAGTLLKPEHLLLKRPGTGLDQRLLEEIINRSLKVAVNKDSQIRLEDLE